MSATIYLEGGGESRELHIRCRENFRRLLERSGFAGRMPRLFASGSRASAFDDFVTAHAAAGDSHYVAMLIDSEDPVVNREATWAHLKARDAWARPAGATDEQVLLMTTCMESWLVCDRDALSRHFGADLQASALPPVHGLEARPRGKVQDQLAHATRKCSNAYAKGKQSFEILGKLDPETLEQHLPSFARVRRVLKKRLSP